MLNDTSIEKFRASLRGELIQPSDERYNEARKVWNGMFDRRPTLIVRCAGTADVMSAVNFGRNESLQVAVRGGGHNYAGLSVCDGGLVIDLSAMRGVEVDPVARTAHFGSHILRPDFGPFARSCITRAALDGDGKARRISKQRMLRAAQRFPISA